MKYSVLALIVKFDVHIAVLNYQIELWQGTVIASIQMITITRLPWLMLTFVSIFTNNIVFSLL